MTADRPTLADVPGRIDHAADCKYLQCRHCNQPADSDLHYIGTVDSHVFEPIGCTCDRDSLRALISDLDFYTNGIDTIESVVTASARLNIPAVGLMWLHHAIAHLNKRLDASFRDRPRIDNEQAAVAIIKSVAADLKAAGTALLEAAEKLKDAHQGHAASKAHLAGKHALQAAQELYSA